MKSNISKLVVIALLFHTSAFGAESMCRGEGGTSYPCSVTCSTGAWANYGTGGQQRRKVETLVCTANCYCTSTYEYRCAAGYYGSSLSCTKCPCMADVDGVERCGTNSAGSTSITSCKMSSAYTFNDGTGNYNFESDCAYTQ